MKPKTLSAYPKACSNRCAAALSACVVVSSLSPVRADENRVHVAADQTTTVVGRFDSLAALIAELCDEAGVELRGFDAADRIVGASCEELPLHAVLERLLSAENFVLGIQGGDPDDGDPEEKAARVVWMQVSGNSPAGSLPIVGGVTLPSSFGDSTFEDEDTSQSARAMRAVAEHLLADKVHVAEFLRVPAKDLALSLGHYPHIRPLLEQLRRQEQHPDVVEKLRAVIAELED